MFLFLEHSERPWNGRKRRRERIRFANGVLRYDNSFRVSRVITWAELTGLAIACYLEQSKREREGCSSLGRRGEFSSMRSSYSSANSCSNIGRIPRGCRRRAREESPVIPSASRYSQIAGPRRGIVEARRWGEPRWNRVRDGRCFGHCTGY